MFKLLQNEKKATTSIGLINSPFRIVSDGSNNWVLKHNNNPDGEKRDLLGYLLAKDFANVVEIKLLSLAELEDVKQFATPQEVFTLNNAFLVKLAHSYSLDELNCKSLEEAVAMELVYSVWIRRRDAHVDNRVYVGGIPVFYDYHVAFLGEQDLADINVFFSQLSDYGRAGRWRVKLLGDFLTQLTRGINKNQLGAYHYVTDLNSFYKKVENSKAVLREKARDQIDSIVSLVQFSQDAETQIIAFLKKNLDTLDADVNRMLEVVTMN